MACVFLRLPQTKCFSSMTMTMSSVYRPRLQSQTVKRGHRVWTYSQVAMRERALNQCCRLYSKEISEAGSLGAPQATQKPTAFQQRVLVLAKMYPSVDKVPDRVSRGQMKKAMDLFRVRASICMAALVFVLASIMAMIGRKQRQDGQTMTKIVLAKRQQ